MGYPRLKILSLPVVSRVGKLLRTSLSQGARQIYIEISSANVYQIAFELPQGYKRFF